MLIGLFDVIQYYMYNKVIFYLENTLPTLLYALHIFHEILKYSPYVELM